MTTLTEPQATIQDYAGYEDWLDSIRARTEPERAIPERRLSLDGSKNADRIEKAAILDYANACHWQPDGSCEVESMSDRRKRYIVTAGGSCNCKDAFYRTRACKHVLAALGGPVVWAIKWIRTCEAIHETMDRYALHLTICEQQGIKPEYVALLDAEYNSHLAKLGDPFAN